jgi:hypothetical protein
MDPVTEAVDLLARAGVPFVREGAGLRVPPEAPDGFEVWIGPGDAWQVAYEGWHADFRDAEQALACFLMGLTDGVRLRVTLRGGEAHAWTVESREGVRLGTVGRIFFAFWRRAEERTLSNRRPISTLRESPPGAAPRSPA